MSDIGNIRSSIEQEIFDYQGLIQCLTSYANPREKIRRLLNAGDLVRVKKGLYTFGDPFRRAPVSRELLANLIYGPSYISLDYALAWHGLIPERVSTVTSVTTGRSRQFTTPYGSFSYQTLSEGRYAVGADLEGTESGSFLLAIPEKAIADKVWCDKQFDGKRMADFQFYLEEDLRMDMNRLCALDLSHLEAVRAAYDSRKIDRLVRFLQSLQEPSNA